MWRKYNLYALLVEVFSAVEKVWLFYDCSSKQIWSRNFASKVYIQKNWKQRLQQLFVHLGSWQYYLQ